MPHGLHRPSARIGLPWSVALVLVAGWIILASGASAASIEELQALVDESRYGEAIVLAGEMLDGLRVEGSDGGAEEAAILESWVEALYRSGAAVDPASLELAERAVALRSGARPVDPKGLASALLHLGNLYYYRSEADSARAQYSRALAVLDRDPDPDEAQLALALNNLGVSWKIAGDYAQALECYEEALARREQFLGPDHPDVAASLNNLANVLVDLGDYQGARQADERALQIRENHYGPDSEWVAESLNNLATVLGYDGKFEEALAAQERAVTVFATTLGEDHERHWAARQNLAAIYADLGDHRGAVRIYEDVLERQGAQFGDDHIQLVEALDGLGESLTALGEYERAERLLVSSLAISEREYGTGSWISAYTLQSLGECLAAAGRYSDATARFMEALHIWEGELEPESPELSELMHLIAEVKLAQGEVEVAAGFARRSAVNVERALGPDHPLLAEALRIDALAARRSGDPERALDSALRAEEISRRHAISTIRVLSDSRALDMAMSRTFSLDLAIELLDDREQSARSARVYDALIRSRALHFDELASRQRSYEQPGDTSIAELVNSMRDARARLANLTIRGPGWEDVAAYRRMIEDAREEKISAERALAQASRRYREEQVGHDFGLEELRAALPEGARVVSYVRAYPADDEIPERYVAFVFGDGDDYPRFVVLGDADDIDIRLARWREAAAWGAAPETPTRGMVRRSRNRDEQEGAYREVATPVRESVWDPVQAAGDGPVFLVPDGNLHLLSFDALVGEDGGFLVEAGTPIRRLPTERFLGSPPPLRDEVPGALFVGAPDYGSVVREISPSGLIFEPLPGARSEVDRLGQVWSESHPELDPPLLLTGAGATEAAFREAAHGRTTLHLATHGYVLPASKDTSSPNPLLRTGLAFAGANARGVDRVSGDDGILTAEELASLDLTHAGWAVLSACDTGLGEIGERGEGVFGLARALQIAGARTVIMSLWAVDDAAALAWMSALYEARFARGLATDESMRAASIQTIQARRAEGLSDHPFYWAAFVSSGSWE